MPRCPTGFYECPADRACQPAAWKCDGVIDCEGGLDEQDCGTKPAPVTSKCSPVV